MSNPVENTVRRDFSDSSVPLPAGEILVVDDDRKNLLAMEVALGELGERLVKAHSGEQALRALLDRDFAVILLDVQMPSMDGFETARIIRTRERSGHVPIIFVTAFSHDDADIRKAYALGAVDFLFKPIVPEVLTAKVHVFVELHRRAQEMKRQAEQLREMERAEAERRLDEQRRSWESALLRQQNEQLEEADRRKDEFLAMLAHELRNPLSPLVTSLELIRMGEFDDPLLLKARDAMERQVHHLIRLVDDLLDVSRITQGKMELDMEPIDMRVVVEQALETSKGVIDTARHKLEVRGDEAPVPVKADLVRLTQVFANLLNNAARYTAAGGTIALSWGIVDGAATFRVRDTGRGITPELKSKIFDMFVQERDGGKGLGLGLTLVRQLVEMHGGQVEAFSEGREQASEFVVTLPLDSQQVRTVVTPVRDGGADGPPLRIALVEDDEDVRCTVRVLLERWGHTVMEADSGPSGVALVAAERPQVALFDIGLPDLDGFGAARQIHEILGTQRPRLVAMTGYGQASDRKRALESGFDAFLVKPAKPEQLRRALRNLE